MKERKQKKTILIAGMAVFIFLAGTLFGTTLSKEPKVQQVEVEKNAAVWKELKKIDDQAFSLAIKQSELSSAGFYAISQSDSGTLQAVTAEVKKNKEEFDSLTDKRKEILNKLGY